MDETHFIPRRPTDGHGWGIFEGRGPYAVGESPVLSPTDRGRSTAGAVRDPAFRAAVTLQPQPSSLRPAVAPTGSVESGGAPSEPKVTSADVLEALHRATGLPIVADFYTRLYKPEQVSGQRQPLLDKHLTGDE